MIKPNLSPSLLQEFDPETFNYQKYFQTVIERVLEVGNLEEWREIMKVYGPEKIKETINGSSRLKDSDKQFCLFFLNSDLLEAA